MTLFRGPLQNVERSSRVFRPSRTAKQYKDIENQSAIIEQLELIDSKLAAEAVNNRNTKSLTLSSIHSDVTS